MAKKIIPAGKSGLFNSIDNLPELRKTLKRLVRDEVLVGVPEEKTERDDPVSQAHDITNAALAYIHDNGAPEAKIPARPFMLPGMARSKDEVTATLTKTAQYALVGDMGKIEQGYERVGLIVVDNIQATIQEGIPPPLAKRTLQARAAKGRKGAQLELDRREQGINPGVDLAKPLIDTAEMLKSISYVIRRRSERDK